MTVPAVLEFARERCRRWVSIASLLPLAGWPVSATAIACSVVIGVLPIGFLIGTGVLVGRIAVAPHGRSASWLAVLTASGLAIGALVLQNTLVPAQAALGELVTRRVDGHCIRRLMRAGLATAPLAMLEEQSVLDRFTLARHALTQRSQTPGSAAAGLVALIARYAQLAGAVAVTGVILGPLAALLISGIAAVVRFGSRSSLTRWSLLIERSFLRPHRQLRYVLDTGSDVAVAKEARTLGLLPWLHNLAQAHADRYHAPFWRERRRIYFTPFLALSAAVFAGTFAVLFLLGKGTPSPLGLSLAIQAIVIPLRMGTFFPESDLATMWGMLADGAMTELEGLFRPSARGPVPRSPARTAAGLPRSGIRFDALHFRYPGSDRPVLAGLDLDLPAGTSTAIVGLNGAGKTTCVKLLAGLYQPTCGRITVDGTDLRDIDPREWQRRIAVIFQDYIRYELDAAANISLSAPSHLANEAALWAAAEQAGAASFLASLPNGLATPLSARYPGGVDLSGGQWQRIALARALFAVRAGASVLVLDEPTAQLDVRAEAAFFEQFLDLTKSLTTVVIAHRFSTVRRAGRIAVLQKGRICETGSHDQLLDLGGRYAHLFRLQAQRFATGLPAVPRRSAAGRPEPP